MLITAVKLENAKSYEIAEVEFTPGVNAIVGHNGAGKSTILEAIGLAIFDELRYKHSEFVRAGARTASVTVTIIGNLDERPYEVVRRLGGTNAHYVHDPETGIRICEGKADVLAFLREHLGVESTTDLSAVFRDAVGVGQGTFTAAFLGTPANRKSVFDPLLQVDDYRKAVDELRAPVRLLDQRRQELAVSVADLRARLEALPELERAVQAREDELQDARKGQERSRAELETAVVQKRALEAVRSELVELRAEQSRAVERQAATARELAAARQTKSDAEEARDLVEKHKAGHGRYVAAQARQKELDKHVRERQRLEAQRAQDDRTAAIAETRLSQLQDELAAIEEAAATVQRLQDAVREQDEIDAQIAQARRDESRLQDLAQHIERERTQLAQFEAHAVRLRQAMQTSGELEAQAAALQAEVEGAQQSIEALRDGGARMQSEAEALKEQTAQLQDVATALCPVCEQPLGEEHRRELLQRNEERLNQLRAQYTQHGHEITSLREAEEEKRKQLQAVERRRRELPRASELERVESDAGSAKRSLDTLNAQQAELSGATVRAEELQRQLAELGDPRRAYSLAQSQAARKQPVVDSIAQTQAALTAVRSRLGAVTVELAQYQALDEEMDACAAELRETEESYGVVLRNGRLAAQIEERTAEVARLELAMSAATQGIQKLAEQVQTTEARFDEEAHAQVSTREQTLRSVLGALEARIEMLQQQQAADRSAIAELRTKQESLATTEAAIAEVDEQAETLEAIRAFLRQAGPYVTQVLIRQVSDNARQIYSDIMQDYSRHLSWTEDYGITLEVDGHTREFTQLSGGEQMTAALAVRLALLRELSNIDVAFFDEPTANLDEARREALARQILEVKGFSQLFVISHDDTFEQSTQNLIRVERMNGTSVVTSG